jgi:hypothetical protein
MDVKISFLNRDIEEEVYIEHLDGFMIYEESHVCRLNKVPYGLKKASWAWYAMIDGHLMILDFKKSVFNPNLCYNTVNGESMILVLYVYYLFLTSTKSLIVEFKCVLASDFEMKDLGIMHYFL